MRPRALIFHPYKHFKQDLSNCYSVECDALGRLLNVHGLDTTIYSGGYADLDSYQQVWLSPFKYDYDTALLRRLSTSYNGRIYQFANDPEFFGVAEELLPKEQFYGKIKAYFCGGGNYVACGKELLRPGEWLPECVGHLPLWQTLFAGKRGNLLDCYEYDLCFVGNTRSPYQTSRLKALLPNKEQFATLAIATNAISEEVTTYLPKQTVEQSMALHKQSMASLYIGSFRCYEELLPIAHRALQGLAYSPVLFVDAMSDPDCKLLPEQLVKHFYISNKQQVEQTIKRLKQEPAFLQWAHELFTQMEASLYNGNMPYLCKK